MKASARAKAVEVGLASAKASADLDAKLQHFDAALFDKTEFKPREQVYLVPDMADFFGGNVENAKWTVRGLTATELHFCLEAAKRQDNVDDLVKALASSGKRVAAIRNAIGLSAENTPGEIAKRLEMLVLGSVNPVIELGTAVKLGRVFPIEFMNITNAIMVLTGKGFDYPKPQPASPPIESSKSA